MNDGCILENLINNCMHDCQVLYDIALRYNTYDFSVISSLLRRKNDIKNVGDGVIGMPGFLHLQHLLIATSVTLYGHMSQTSLIWLTHEF